jgi:prefoldin subunit 5
MLSQDIDNAAASIDRMKQKVNEGARVSMSELRGLQSNLRDYADQARQLEAQMAPGSPVIDNVRAIAFGQAAARA